MFLFVNSKKSFWLVGVAIAMAFVAGFGLGKAVRPQPVEPERDGGSCTMDRGGTGELTNPLLDCELADGKLNQELVPFKIKLEQAIKEKLTQKQAAHIAVYFRDLNNGAWTGIGEKEEYSPASLLKIPVMLAYYKWSEDEPGILERKLIQEQRDSNADYAQFVQAEQEIMPGKSYTVQELINRMITYSDNQANSLLVKNISQTRIENVFKLLGVPVEVYKNNGAEITVKNYAAFFRILFNASYLNRENSNSALRILINTKFKAGLVAGLPRGIAVAHKFGERGDDKIVKQFHDCGIVYHPKRPYILCIMTKGSDYWQQINAISGISKLVYDEVDAQFSAK